MHQAAHDWTPLPEIQQDQLGPNCKEIDGSAGDADARMLSNALPSNLP